MPFEDNLPFFVGLHLENMPPEYPPSEEIWPISLRTEGKM